MEKNYNNEFKTTTLSGQMVISKTESGLDMVHKQRHVRLYTQNPQKKQA